MIPISRGFEPDNPVHFAGLLDEIQIDPDEGIIGPGLLVGSGNALHLAGPAGILISFSLVGLIVFFVMYTDLPFAFFIR